MLDHKLLDQVADRDKAWMQNQGVVLPAPQLQVQPNELQVQPVPPQIDQPAQPFQIGHRWESLEPGVFDQETLRARRIQCNSFVCFSDSRCKKDVRTLSSQDTLAILSRMQAKKFKYKMEFGGDDKDVYGFIAQEVREACPDLVEEVVPSFLPFPLSIFCLRLLCRLNQAS